MKSFLVYFYFILFVLSTLCGTVKGQVLTFNHRLTYYYNGIISKKQFVEAIEIFNPSDSDWVTFVALEDEIENQPVDYIIRKHFLKPHGDFSWMEYLVGLTFVADKSILGYTFLAKISPQKKFIYYVIKDDDAPCKYIKKIVNIERRKLEKYLGYPIDQKLFYDDDMIILKDY